jgi:hypothetical protein
VRLPIALVTFLLTLLNVSPALATTVVTPDGAPAEPYQSWANRSQVPGPPGTVVVHLESCPGGAEWAGACALPQQRAIYLGPGAMDKGRFLHELGHVFDATAMTDPLRQLFQSVTRRRGIWAAAANTDPPIEQFAEAYSLCARYSTIRTTFFGMYAYTPTPDRHRRACSVIKQAAAAASLA